MASVLFEGSELAMQSLEGLLGLLRAVLGRLPFFAAFSKRGEKAARLLGELLGLAQLRPELGDFGLDLTAGIRPPMAYTTPSWEMMLGQM